MGTTDLLSARVSDLEEALRLARGQIQQLQKDISLSSGNRRGTWKAVLSEDLAVDGTADAKLWRHNGTTLIETSITIEVEDWFGVALPSGTKIEVQKMQDGKWWPISPGKIPFGSAVFYKSSVSQNTTTAISPATSVTSPDDDFELDSGSVLVKTPGSYLAHITVRGRWGLSTSDDTYGLTLPLVFAVFAQRNGSNDKGTLSNSAPYGFGRFAIPPRNVMDFDSMGDPELVTVPNTGNGGVENDESFHFSWSYRYASLELDDEVGFAVYARAAMSNVLIDVNFRRIGD